MNTISLEEEEGEGLLIEETGGDSEFQGHGFNSNLCVVSRFISEGKVNFMALHHTMTALWKPGRGVFIKSWTQICIFSSFIMK